jgi:hypothetical protein
MSFQARLRSADLTNAVSEVGLHGYRRSTTGFFNIAQPFPRAVDTEPKPSS